MTICECGGQILFDLETFEQDEAWNESNMIYMDGKCDKCKKEFSISFSEERRYEK